MVPGGVGKKLVKVRIWENNMAIPSNELQDILNDIYSSLIDSRAKDTYWYNIY